MTTPSISAPASRRRRIRYVDQALQKWLVVAVVLEVGAAAGTVGLLYWRLSALIDENLYRVHLGAASSIVPALLHDGSLLLLAFVGLNVLALLVATVVWGGYVGGILRNFVDVVGKTLRMDFSADTDRQGNHEVLELAAQWRTKERARLAAISEQMAQLAEFNGQADTRGPARESLRRLQELLR
jgi:hypothetical protein